jgi:steroid delta-isomerase-like uncharacterized protein
MYAAKNIEIIRCLYMEVFDRRNVTVVDDLYTADFIYHAPGRFAGNPHLDREGLKQGFTHYLSAFPDLQLNLEDIFASGEKVASRFTAIGTHQGIYKGVRATKKRICKTGIIIHRLEADRIIEAWEWTNSLSIMQQLGIISIPGFDFVPPSTTRHLEIRNLLSPEENIAIVKRVIDNFNQGNLDILDEVCSPDFAYHGPSNPDWDRESIKAALGMMFKSIPDMRMELDDIIATKDKAAYRISWEGTHQGELWGVPPTGKKITRTGMLIDHFTDGKIVEEWQWMDWLGLMRQLGLVPESAGA